MVRLKPTVQKRFMPSAMPPRHQIHRELTFLIKTGSANIIQNLTAFSQSADGSKFSKLLR
jgi:hypothetical protein